MHRDNNMINLWLKICLLTCVVSVLLRIVVAEEDVTSEAEADPSLNLNTDTDPITESAIEEPTEDTKIDTTTKIIQTTTESIPEKEIPNKDIPEEEASTDEAIAENVAVNEAATEDAKIDTTTEIIQTTTESIPENKIPNEETLVEEASTDEAIAENAGVNEAAFEEKEKVTASDSENDEIIKESFTEETVVEGVSEVDTTSESPVDEASKVQSASAEIVSLNSDAAENGSEAVNNTDTSITTKRDAETPKAESAGDAKPTEDSVIDIDEGIFPNSIGSMVPFGTFGTKSYYFSKGFKVNFFQAYEICKDLNMQLLTVNSKIENDYLFKSIENATKKSEKYWTSGSNFLTRKNWLWMTSASRVQYTNWQPGKPSEPDKKCIHLVWLSGQDLKWNNEDCNEKQSFICELDNYGIGMLQNRWTNILGIVSEPLVFNYNKKTYYIVNDLTVTFFDAERVCQMIGLELVSISTEAENNELLEHIRNSMAGTTFWSSGNKIKDGTNWFWFSSGEKITYKHWKEGQPGDGKCLQLNYGNDAGLEWNSMDCKTLVNFICETPNRISQVRNAMIGKRKSVKGSKKQSISLTPSAIDIKITSPQDRLTFTDKGNRMENFYQYSI